MVTMKDIAETVGVSRTTVSAVLNGKQTIFNISNKTRDAIEKTARKLNYYRNGPAISMVTGKTRDIAYFSHNLNLDSFVGKLFYGVTTKAAEYNYYVKLSGFTVEKFKENVRSMLEQRPTGIIAQLYPGDEYHNYLTEQAKIFSTPIVFIGGPNNAKSGIFVHTNDVAGAFEAVDYFYRFGHRRIGYLGIPGDNQLRYIGYKNGLKKKRLKFNKDYVFTNDDYDRFFTMPVNSRPTALFGATDKYAMDFVKKTYKARVRVPDEVSLIGFGDVQARLCVVPLTSVHQPFEQFGRELVTLLDKEIKRPEKISFNKVIEKVINVKLTERESVAPPAN